ncbi:MAG: Flagellin N-methylase [Methanosaeta sp. PtaU1.Bin112]|nr:MAG: Flagellin N-methylase [Methanosaeta sp. PtaU1.Bin112]
MLDGWIRRRIIWYLNNKQVLEWRAKRHGQCARCGKCCGSCLAYDSKKKRCRIYRIRPSICKAFPLTPEDLDTIQTCGFYFDK